MTDQEIDKWVEEHIKIPPKEEWTSVVYPDLVPAVIKWGKNIAHKFYRIGKAEKDLGWHSVDDCLPEVDEEVIVLTDELGTAPIYKIAFGHIVDRMYCSDYNGWSIPGVKFWMPCPTIPNEEKI